MGGGNGEKRKNTFFIMRVEGRCRKKDRKKENDKEKEEIRLIEDRGGGRIRKGKGM